MDNLKIAISGYGQMGEQIESLASDIGYEVVQIFDLENPPKAEDCKDFEVAIDFTMPRSVFANVEEFAKAKKKVVLGTTGWYHRSKDLEKIIWQNDSALIWGSNFSVGVNLFFKIIESASKLAGDLDEFDWMIHEIHHKRKKDSPSGTAETLASIILKNVRSKKLIERDRIEDQINPAALHVSSTRGGEITGRHTVFLDSISDSLELTHRAKSRKGFAYGALLAANWISDKRGFYNYSEVFEDIISK